MGWEISLQANPPDRFIRDIALVTDIALTMLGNFHSHLALRSLRSRKESKRYIPHGFWFDLVSCPHYFFEVLEWILFATLVPMWTSVLFAAQSPIILYIRAKERHDSYLAEFPDYPRSRKILIPFIL